MRGWSWPKLILWSELAHEAEVEHALLQAAAVWGPDKVADRLAERRRARGPAAVPDWEPMAERIARLERTLKDG